jgi:hypothetical protein
MKIIIGGRDIEVPRFMAEGVKEPENGRQFHAFLKLVLAAQAGKVRGDMAKERQFDGMSALERLSGFVSGFKERK